MQTHFQNISFTASDSFYTTEWAGALMKIQSPCQNETFSVGLVCLRYSSSELCEGVTAVLGRPQVSDQMLLYVCVCVCECELGCVRVMANVLGGGGGGVQVVSWVESVKEES